MAKVGLAAELAKQAAQAAREEMAAAHAEETAPAAKAAPAKPWTVPVLAPRFQLDDAMQNATLKVTNHYRTVLAPQGLMVDLETADVAGSVPSDVAPVRQPEPQLQANLREQQSGRLVKAYTAPALLTLFATQQQATGVVVDGQV